MNVASHISEFHQNFCEQTFWVIGCPGRAEYCYHGIFDELSCKSVTIDVTEKIL